MIYAYTAIDAANRVARGRRDAESEDHLLLALRGEGLRDVAIRAAWWSQPLIGGRIAARDIADFTRFLSAYITSTGNPAEALRMLQQQMPSASFRRVLQKVATRHIEGLPLAQAMREHPRVFSRVYCNVVEVGERSGRLQEILEKMADTLTLKAEIDAKTRSAMFYPAAMLVISILLGGFMVYAVVPTFAKIIVDAGGELPPMTRLLLGLSVALKANLLLAAGMLGAIILLLPRVLRDPRVSDRIGQAVSRIPAVGKLIQVSAMSAFCRTFALLISSGIPVWESITMASETVTSRRIGKKVASAAEEVAAGGPLAGALERTGAVDLFVIANAEVGEKTGRLEELMDRTAIFYEKQVENLTRQISSITEIAMLVVVGILISTLVISLWLPMMSATRSLGSAVG